MTPEAYRQRLSRVRKKMAGFLGQYCGAYGSGKCNCKDRVNYAIQNHRINPLQLDYVPAAKIPIQTTVDVKNAMEEIDDLSQDFSFCKPYASPERTKHLIQEFLDSTQLSRMLATGSDFHASVSDTGYSISGETLRREIQNAPVVSEAFLLGVKSAVSTEPVYTGSEHQGMGIVFTDSEKSLSHLFMTPTTASEKRSVCP